MNKKLSSIRNQIIDKWKKSTIYYVWTTQPLFVFWLTGVGYFYTLYYGGDSFMDFFMIFYWTAIILAIPIYFRINKMSMKLEDGVRFWPLEIFSAVFLIAQIGNLLSIYSRATR